MNASVSRDDGFYLSSYLAPLGTAALASHLHDHCVALWEVKSGQLHLRRYWELERQTGLKHHNAPLYTLAETEAFLEDLLASEGVSLADIRHHWGTLGVGEIEDLQSFADTHDLPLHSLAHLMSAVAMDGTAFGSQPIIGLALDGGPDMATETRSKRSWFAGCYSVPGQPLSIFPVESPAAMFSAAKARFGLEPGSLMALASASTSKLLHEPHRPVDSFTFFGPEARPNAESLLNMLVESGTSFGVSPDTRFNADESLISAVMKVVQDEAHRVMIRNISKIEQRFSITRADTTLAMAGGYALNCPNNTRIMNEFNFARLLAPPCVNDGGQALGLGLLGWYLTKPKVSNSFDLAHPYHGCDDLQLDRALAHFSGHVLSVSTYDTHDFVEDIMQGPVAWVQGPAEIGPRALGARSLLGDPRRQDSRHALNIIKQRQWWRPVAPIVLEEFAREWFIEPRSSPFMLEAFEVARHRTEEVPAVVHLDGTARVQTLARHSSPLLYDCIEAFRKATGVPMVCNTSLNDRGEPIVDKAMEAVNFCLRRGVAILYVGDRRIELSPSSDVPDVRQERPMLKRFELESARDALWDEWLGQGHDVESVLLVARNPEARHLANLSGSEYTLRRLLRLTRIKNPYFDDALRHFVAEKGPGSRPSWKWDGEHHAYDEL